MIIDNYNLPLILTSYLTLAGSRVWGGATKSSDVDLFANYDDLVTIKSLLKQNDILFNTKSTFYELSETTIEFTLNGLLFQISFFDNTKYPHIVNTVNIMTTTAFMYHVRIPNKKSRQDIFTSIYSYLTNPNTDLHPIILQVIKTRYPELLI